MAGRKRKPDALRFADLTSQIEKLEDVLSAGQKRLNRMKEERIAVLSHMIVGRMEVLRLNYPQVESLLTQLFKGQPTSQQKKLVENAANTSLSSEEDNDREVQLIIRVSGKEKRQMYENMRKAQYTSFNSYAKKMLLDGYLIVWSSPETRELKKELGNVNRSLNQLVKRANSTGSIYSGDFMDILECWKKIEKETLHYIDEMNRKGA
jgi:hypothetical protein